MAQNINVDVTPNLFQPTLYYHQGDIGRAFTITISTKDGYTIPSGATVKIEATKPSGLGFSVSGTLSGNVVSFVSTEGMTDEYGRFPAQLKITSGNDILYTANFLMVGAINTHPASVTDGTAEQVISEITLLVERAETAASTAATDAANAAQARVDEMMDYLPSEVADLKSDLTQSISMDTFDMLDSAIWEVGTIVSGATSSSATRVRTKDYIDVSYADLVRVNIDNGYKYVIVWYGDNGFISQASFSTSSAFVLVPSGATKYKVVVADINNGTADVSYGNKVSVLASTADKTASECNEIKLSIEEIEIDLNELLVTPNLRNGSVANLANANGVCCLNVIPYENADAFVITINRDLTSADNHYRFQYTTFSVASGTTYGNIANRVNSDINVELLNGQNKLFFAKPSDGSVGFGFTIYERTPSDTSVPIRVENLNNNAVVVSKENILSNYGYYVDAGFNKTEKSLSFLGTLTYIQSFLKYKGKYYSTEGTHIAVQDSHFVQQSTTALAVGHGNSFCLGEDGKGYISGWDDNTVYVIDLENIAIEDTIALPTTGYTNCAVDTTNGLLYIFQRDSYPSTKAQYNLIVYDYVNGEVKSTVKTSVPYAAIQSVDLYRDRLIVLYGTGVSEKPNGYIVYSKNGDILGEYVFPEFSGVEPEGVFIDRDTHDLYISYLGGKVYKVV